MKKLILPIVLGLLTISTVSAKEKLPNRKANTAVVVSVESLCQLIRKGDYNKVKEMLNKGQKVNEKLRGYTPLMHAARYNRHKIAKLLIGYGADVNAVSDKGEITAIKLTRKYKARETYYVIKKAIDKAKKANSKTA